MPSQRSADVVVVGAGVTGCAAAYYLTRLGVKPLLLERDAVASGASGAALGDLNNQHGHGLDGPLFDLAAESLRMHRDLHPRLREEAGMDTGLRFLECISVAVESGEEAGLRGLMDWQRGRGLDAGWADGAALRRLEPRLAPDIPGGLVTGGMGMVEPSALTVALLQAAERGGATLAHAQVTGLRCSGGRVTGVETPGGVVGCAAVVVALGPWSVEAGRWLGLPLPVRPVKGQIVRLRAPGPAVERYITWHAGDIYAVGKADGLVWTGTTEEEAGFDRHPTAEARELVLKGVARLLPSFQDAEVVLQTACLRPVAPDWLPVVGVVPGLEGAVVATAGARKGILLGPAMGRAAAELAVRGSTDLPVGPFSPARFAGG